MLLHRSMTSRVEEGPRGRGTFASGEGKNAAGGEEGRDNRPEGAPYID